MHTVGPIYTPTDKDRSVFELAQTFYNCLLFAEKLNLQSITFPFISTGKKQREKERKKRERGREKEVQNDVDILLINIYHWFLFFFSFSSFFLFFFASSFPFFTLIWLYCNDCNWPAIKDQVTNLLFFSTNQKDPFSVYMFVSVCVCLCCMLCPRKLWSHFCNTLNWTQFCLVEVCCQTE